MATAYWLFKSEPDVFSYDDLARKGSEGWDGVRNYMARNYMRAMKVGDQAIFYHSQATPPGIAGVCEVIKTAEPDMSQFDPKSKYFDAGSKRTDPRWDLVTVAPVKKLNFVSLEDLRSIPELTECRLLAKGNRLSVMPLTAPEFRAIVAVSQKAGRRG